MNSERTVVVTGFGPFKNHAVNASWEAVRELYKFRDSLRESCNVNLVIYHVPVVYDHVFEKIPRVWEEHDPELVLHVGVSHIAKCLTIEDTARGTCYARPDVSGKCPSKNCESSPPVIETAIDVIELCRKINNQNDDADGGYKACVSHDAGRYLCEYIYYQSLRINSKRTLFVHVPDIDVYPSETTAKSLLDIIEILIN